MGRSATQVDDGGGDPDRAARERAAGQLSDALLDLECTLDKAHWGRKAVAEDGVGTNAELALGNPVPGASPQAAHAGHLRRRRRAAAGS